MAKRHNSNVKTSSKTFLYLSLVTINFFRKPAITLWQAVMPLPLPHRPITGAQTHTMTDSTSQMHMCLFHQSIHWHKHKNVSKQLQHEWPQFSQKREKYLTCRVLDWCKFSSTLLLHSPLSALSCWMVLWHSEAAEILDLSLMLHVLSELLALSTSTEPLKQHQYKVFANRQNEVDSGYFHMT